MAISTLGLELGKTWFDMVGLEEKERSRRVVVSRATGCWGRGAISLLAWSACKLNAAPTIRDTPQTQGRRVRLMTPQSARPFVKSNRTDYRNAEVNVDAVQRLTSRFVSPKVRRSWTCRSCIACDNAG